MCVFGVPGVGWACRWRIQQAAPPPFAPPAHACTVSRRLRHFAGLHRIGGLCPDASRDVAPPGAARTYRGNHGRGAVVPQPAPSRAAGCTRRPSTPSGALLADLYHDRAYGGLFRSADGGQSWKRLASDVGASDYAVVPSPGGARLCVSNRSVQCSDDDGLTFGAPLLDPATLGLGAGSVASLDVDDAGRLWALYGLYAGTTISGAVLRSLDGGATWARVYDLSINDQALSYSDLAAAAGVAVATSDAHVRSDDGGETWTTLGDVLDSPYPTRSLAWDAGRHAADEQLLGRVPLDGPRRQLDAGRRFRAAVLDLRPGARRRRRGDGLHHVRRLPLDRRRADVPAGRRRRRLLGVRRRRPRRRADRRRRLRRRLPPARARRAVSPGPSPASTRSRSSASPRRADGCGRWASTAPTRRPTAARRGRACRACRTTR